MMIHDTTVVDDMGHGHGHGQAVCGVDVVVYTSQHAADYRSCWGSVKLTRTSITDDGHGAIPNQFHPNE
eukprot:scaffold521_cov177-Ochromonas_danica.AAC.12